MKNKLMDAARVTETHFGFRRMHIDVDTRWIQIKKQYVGRLARAMQDIGPGLSRGMGKQFVTHEATIDEEILFVTTGAGIGRQGRQTAQA